MIGRRLLPQLAIAAAVGIGHFGMAKLGLLFVVEAEGLAAVWPASGFLLAVLFLLPRRHWPAAIVGAFAAVVGANLGDGNGLWLSLGFGFANTAESTLGAYAVQRLVGPRIRFGRAREVIGFGVVAGLGCALTALLGAGIVAWGIGTPFWDAWRVWWIADSVGMLIVTPLFLSWAPLLGRYARQRKRPPTARVLEFLTLVGTTVIVVELLFELNTPVTYQAFPVLVWAALRFGPAGAAVANVILSTLVIPKTAAGGGPFAMAGNSVTEQILAAQVFSAMCYLTALGLAAAWKERRLAEEQSRETETRYRAIVETANDAFVGMGSDGRITDWNAAAEAMFGWSREEAIGSRLAETIFPERYRQLGALARHFETGEVRRPGRTVEFFALHRDGHELSVEVTTWPVSVGKEQTFSAFVRDITARKTAEEELTMYAAELERTNRELEEFAYVASHDLQEPLRKIRAFGDLFVLRFGSALGEEARDYLARIQGAAARAQNLMDDFLAFSRLTTRRSERVRVDLGEIARELVAEFETALEKTGGRIEVGELPELEADRQQMRELFRNLIDNGLKFHRPGEPPVVRVSRGDVENGSYRIVFADSGIGFEPRYADRIFTTFERLHSRDKYAGTGMGLALCRKIVQRHGGTITATSVPGEGSSFAVTLPMLPALSARPGDRSRSPEFAEKE